MTNTGDLEREDAAFLVLTFGRKTSADCLGEAPAKIEAEPGAADFAGVATVDAIEFLEEMRQIFRRDAYAGILDTYLDVLVIACDIDRDAAVRCVLDSVFDQVRDDFAQVVIIDIGVIDWVEAAVGLVLGIFFGIGFVEKDQAFRLGLWPQALDDLLYERYNLDHLGIVREPAVIGF